MAAMAAAAALMVLTAAAFTRTDTLLVRTGDGGQTWHDIDPGPQYQTLAWLKIDPSTSTLYTLASAGLHEEWRLLASPDRGGTWHLLRSFPPDYWRILAAGPFGGALHIAYTVLRTGKPFIEIAEITDAGRRIETYPADGLALTPVSAPSQYAVLLDLISDPSMPWRHYALVTADYADDISVFFQSLWRSSDSGRSWSRIEVPVTGGDCIYPAIHVAASSLYLVCASGLLLRSQDGGESWLPTRTGSQAGNLVIAAGSFGVMYTHEYFRPFGEDLLNQRVLWKSTDAAETWQRSGRLPPEVRMLEIDRTNPSRIFAAGSSGVLKSEDSGATWEPLLPTRMDAPWLLEVLADPAQQDTLYAMGRQRFDFRRLR